MSKRILLLLLVVLVVALTMGLAGADACPPKSKNPGGTPPNCGHGPSQPPPPGCTEDGPVSGLVRTTVEPIDPTGGHSGSPTSGGVVHRVNCTVVWDLLGL